MAAPPSSLLCGAVTSQATQDVH